jgi:SpoVK/Ycf46/Vps4 family AAA+-type ATPase
MARADLLKSLFRAYRSSDVDGYSRAANAIIEEERLKNHGALADELSRIMGSPSNGGRFMRHDLGSFMPPPKDGDRNRALLEPRLPDRYLKDVFMSEPQREAVHAVMRDFQHWDVLMANGLRPNHKILFCGPPGCGKTITAEAIAGELGLPILHVRFDSVVSSLLGETSSNIRKVFEYAQNGSWVLFFDEFDAIGRSRDDALEHGEIKRVVNAFLQLLDGFTGMSLVVAATNYEQALDYAVWRRFDEIIRFDLPEVDQIRRMLCRHLGLIHGVGVDLGRVSEALRGFSFAEIERVALEIRKVCVLEGRNHYSSNDTEHAIQREKDRQRIYRSVNAQHQYPKVDKE